MKDARGGLNLWGDREQLGSWRHTITLILLQALLETYFWGFFFTRVSFHLCQGGAGNT